MSIDAITEKIVNDASEYADSLISGAILEAEGIVSEAMREAEIIRERSAANSVKDTAAIINKMTSAAELEARKMRLAVKQKEFSGATDAAIDRITNMETKTYIAFLVYKIVETGVRSGELKLNAKDRKTIGKRLIKAANEQIKGGKLKLSDDTIEAKGGFALISGDIEIDSSLETMAFIIKDGIAAKACTVLFQT